MVKLEISHLFTTSLWVLADAFNVSPKAWPLLLPSSPATLFRITNLLTLLLTKIKLLNYRHLKMLYTLCLRSFLGKSAWLVESLTSNCLDNRQVQGSGLIQLVFSETLHSYS